MDFGLPGAFVAELYREARKIELSRKTTIIVASISVCLLVLIPLRYWMSGPSHRVPSPEQVAAQQKQSVNYLSGLSWFFGNADAPPAKPGKP